MWQQLKTAISHSRQRSRNRRDYAYLTEMPDHILRDVGVHRGDVRYRTLGS